MTQHSSTTMKPTNKEEAHLLFSTILEEMFNSISKLGYYTISLTRTKRVVKNVVLFESKSKSEFTQARYIIGSRYVVRATLTNHGNEFDIYSSDSPIKAKSFEALNEICVESNNLIDTVYKAGEVFPAILSSLCDYAFDIESVALLDVLARHMSGHGTHLSMVDEVRQHITKCLELGFLTHHGLITCLAHYMHDALSAFIDVQINLSIGTNMEYKPTTRKRPVHMRMSIVQEAM